MKKIVALLLAFLLLCAAVPVSAVSYAPAAVDTGAKPKDFEGTWSVIYIGAEGKIDTADEALAVINLFRGPGEQLSTLDVAISGARLSFPLIDMVAGEPVLLPLAYSGGKMTCKYEKLDAVITVCLQEDGILKMTIPTDDGDGDYYCIQKNSAEPADPEKTATVSGGVYRLNETKKTAVFTAPEKKSAKKLVVPDKILVDGKTYKVTKIADGACKGMKKLASLTIGKNVKTIGKEAFRNCKALKSITIKTAKLTEDSVGKNAFGGIAKKAAVRCPKKQLDAYRSFLKGKGLPDKAVIR